MHTAEGRAGSDARGSAITRAQQFVHEVLAEMRKVVWPTPRQTAMYTLVVLISVAVLAASIFLADSVFRFIVGLVVKQ